MKNKTYAEYIKHRPATNTTQEDYEAGWDAAVKAAAELVDDYVCGDAWSRAGQRILEEL